MKVLVTGGSGFVGSELIDVLSSRGHCGIVTGRKPPTRLPEGWHAAARDSVLGNGFLGSRPDMCVDAVIHLEVQQRNARHEGRHLRPQFLRNDTAVIGTTDWLAWADRNAVRCFCLFSSTLAMQTGNGLVTENATRQPETAYGRSKAVAEEMVEAWNAASSDRRGVILRPAPVYGPDSRSNLLAFVKQVADGKPCLVGRGDAVKSLVSRRNIAAAAAWAVEQDSAGCLTYIVTDREQLSYREIGRILASAAAAPPPRGVPLWLARCAATAGDWVTAATGKPTAFSTPRFKALQPDHWFSCQKLIDAGFVHPQSAHDGLREMMTWWQATRFQREGVSAD